MADARRERNRRAVLEAVKALEDEDIPLVTSGEVRVRAAKILGRPKPFCSDWAKEALNELARDGLLHRRIDGSFPYYACYGVTKKGQRALLSL